MKSPKPSLTPNNSLAAQPLEFTGSENSFVFETLSRDVNKYNCIYAGSPIKCFDNLEELDKFISSNSDILSWQDAGIAGYISYEGKTEFALYKEILQAKLPLKFPEEGTQGQYKVVKPNAKEFIDAINQCKEHIKEGDIYQANLAQKFIIETDKKTSGLSLYQNLKALNPAPYAGYMNFKNFELISSSPESFIKLNKIDNETWKISSSPIKGTAPLNKLNELISSSKEKAEHIMIVDLIRNDLGKICLSGSIEVQEFLAVHQFRNLYHLVSNIEGQLMDECINKNLNVPKFAKIFQACFPGGSITGAPKKRAMEIINKLENNPRGPYTGTMGYYKFSGEGEFNILIRTIVINKQDGEISFHSGAGITAESVPENEIQEIYLKAEKLVGAFESKFDCD